MPEIQLHESWKTPLLPEFSSDYMAALKQFLQSEKAAGKTIYPKGNEWFRAFRVSDYHVQYLLVNARCRFIIDFSFDDENYLKAILSPEKVNRELMMSGARDFYSLKEGVAKYLQVYNEIYEQK